MQISIIGSGHVGLITGLCFAEKGHQVLCVDHDAAKIEALKTGDPTFHEPGLEALLKKHLDAGSIKFSASTPQAVEFGKAIFICVSTPSRPNRRVDMSYVEAVSHDIASNLKEYRVIVEKSTVPILTGENVKRTMKRYAPPDATFDVVSNPEFLREGAAIDDTLNPTRIVIGVESEMAEKVMREVYAGFAAPMVVTSIQSSELIKHASNAFLAMRLSFINGISRICEAAGADVDEVAHGMGLDPRIGAHFLQAGIGYGGHCFPKDVDAFYYIAQDLDYDFELLRQVQEINEDQWRHFANRIERELWVVRGKTIGVWGISFKPDTDDIRQAPAIKIARELLERGAKVQAYDPVALPHAAVELPDLDCCKDELAAAEGADALLLCTEWPQFKAILMESVRDAMKVPLIFDGRNFLDGKELRELGFAYHSVGR